MLIIEDNRVNMELACTLLKIAGFVVLQTEDAERGIGRARAENPTLILMDISLPGMDGLAATKILKQDPQLRDTPVVALTAHAMKGDEARMLAAGCVGYIAKPIDTGSFAKRVAGFLPPAP